MHIQKEINECNYCNGFETVTPLIDGDALLAYIESGFMTVEGRGWDGEFQSDDLKINFCPMCGGRC